MADLGEIVEHICDTVNRELFTCLPAVVTNVDDFQSLQMIDVRPSVGRLRVDGTSLIPPIIVNVPVMFPSAGGALLSMPIKVGDIVLVLFSMRDIDNFTTAANGNPIAAKTSRHHALTDAIAICGLHTTKTHLSPDPDNVVLKFGGTEVVIDPSGNTTINSAGNVDIQSATNITINATGNIDISATGNVNISGATINLN